MGNFWSCKTFWTNLEAFEASPDTTYIISNVPYSVVNYYRSTEEDLLNVISVLEDYAYWMNHDLEKYFDNQDSYKDILFIIDEAHLYFDARSALAKSNNLQRLNLLLTQCRKRKITMLFITQRLTQIDIRIRRLCDYVTEYHKWHLLWIERVKKTVYENKGDVADIETDQNVKFTGDWEASTYKEDAKLYSELFFPMTTILNIIPFFRESYRRILKEEYETYHICGVPDSRVWEFNLQILLDGLKVPEKPKKEYLPTFKKRKNQIQNYLFPKPVPVIDFKELKDDNLYND